VLSQYTAAFRRFLKLLDPPQRGTFLLLAAAFVKRRSLPIRRLARSVAGPNSDCRRLDKRFRAFLGNKRLDIAPALPAQLNFLLPRFGAVPFISVALDWTYVKDHAILWAQIPYRGRSFPLLVAIHPATKAEPDSEFQTQAELDLLQTLTDAWPTWAPPPLLLADRGFAKGDLIHWLVRHRWLFIIRVTRQLHCRTAAGERLPATPFAAPGQTLLYPEIRTRYYDPWRLPLHLVVAGATDQTGAPVEWRLLTSLSVSQLRRVSKLYADRMQPEETHRDCKRGHFVSGFALSHLGRMRRDRLERYLFLLGLIYCFLILLAETDPKGRAWFRVRQWGLSLITFALELLHAPGAKIHLLVDRALAWGLLRPQWAENGDC
jgi:hypothetical protein